MTTKAMKLQSGHAILDVKHGRKQLANAIGEGHSIPVTITGVISRVHSGDDGTSIEFQVDVAKVEASKP